MSNKEISKKIQMDTNVKDVSMEQAYQYFIDMGMIQNFKDHEQQMIIALINRVIYLDALVDVSQSYNE